MARAYGSCNLGALYYSSYFVMFPPGILAARGVASAYIVPTDFSPSVINLWVDERTVGSTHIDLLPSTG